MTNQQAHAYESVAAYAEEHGLSELADAIRDMADTDAPVVDNVALCQRRHEENARQ